MTAAAGFKRVGLALAALLILSVGLLVAAPLLISAETAREAVKAEIRAVSGLEPVLRGPVSIALFPSGNVSIGDVTVGEDAAGNKALTADRLIARLRFLPMLLGEIQVSDLTLVNPTVNVTIEPEGKSNWTPLASTLSAALRPSAERNASFSEVRIDNGTVVFRDDARGIVETISNVEGSLAWPALFRSFAATGHFDWRGEQVEANLGINDFVAALAGEPAGIKVRLTGAPLKVVFEGKFSTRPTLKVEGTVTADALSLRDAANWAAHKQLPGGGFGHFSMKAKTSVAGGNIALSAVDVELDGNAAEGVLSFASDGRQTLQGTLAAEGIDLTPYVSAIRLLAGDDREWDGMPIKLDNLAGFDLDLRLSAAAVKLSGTKLGRTAIATHLRGGRLTLTVGESQSFGGIIKGSLDLARSAPGAELKAQLQFTDVDLQSCLGTLLGLQRLEGKGNVAFNIEGAGNSVMGLTKTLNGSATLTGLKGAVTGINIERLLRRLERRPLSGGGDYKSGRTPYDKLTVALSINDGTIKADELRLDGQTVKLVIDGKASIPTRDLDFKGVASLVPASGSDTPGFELPFMVRGAWDEPLMLLDTEALIRRAPAAAPLLDAVRNRTAREAVRSAIDRLVGNTSAAPAAATPAPSVEGN